MARRKVVFVIRLSEEERQALNIVAAILKRSSADTVRYLVISAAEIAAKLKDTPRTN